MERLAYGIEEVAEMLGCSSGFIRLEWKRGKLVITKLGRRRVVMKPDLDAYLQAGRKA